MSKINVSVTDGTNVNLTVSPRPVQTITVSRGSTGGGGGIGTVTEVTANAPLSVTNGTTTPDLSIAAATDSVSGYLTSTDHATFNAKVGSITSADGSITVTGTTTRDLSVTSSPNVIVAVRNNTGATLTKGTAVYINGAIGQLPTVTKAQANSDAASAQTLGLMTTDLANNANGYVTIIGLITNINTSAYTDGQQLYLSPTVAGGLTTTKPSAPQHLVYVAVVEHAHITQGKLFVKVQNGYELDELHDVQIVSPANGQTLTYDSATSLWKNTTPTSGGITGSGTTNYVTKFTGTSAIGNSVIYDDGTNVGIGTTIPSYKLMVVGTAGVVNPLLLVGIFGVSNGFTINADASNNLTYSFLTGSAGTQGLYQNTLGNVGIGTSSPATKLDIGGNTGLAIQASLTSGADANFHLYAVNGSSTNASGEEVARFGVGYNGNAATSFGSGFSFMRGGGSSDGSLAILTNANERMRIDSSGNVGIGTNSPTTKLDVNGGVSCTTLTASSTISGTGFSNYLASPPAIGGTTPNTILGTTINGTTITGGTLLGGVVRSLSRFTVDDTASSGYTADLAVDTNGYAVIGGSDYVGGTINQPILAPAGLALGDSSTAVITLNAAPTSSYILNLPPTAGSANQLLTTDGIGNLSWSNPLTLNGTTDPTAPTGTNTKLYSKSFGGYPTLAARNALNTSFGLQSALWSKATYSWSNSTSAGGYWTNMTGTGGGTLGVISPTAGATKYQATRRSTYNNLATTTNQVLGIQPAQFNFFRGSVAGQGGFFFYAKCGFDIWTNGSRFFCGMATATTVISADPSALNDTVGFCVDAADNGAISFLTRGTAATKASTGLTITSNKGYECYIYCSPNSSQYTWQIIDINTGTSASGTATANLPTNTTMQTCYVLASNAALTAVSSTRIGVVNIYVETDN